ncbi:MAG: hypothetical protein E7369_04065 [Clostridiales bacterium]|nr:hypothetical protein [Clostridiales bacterium]
MKRILVVVLCFVGCCCLSFGGCKSTVNLGDYLTELQSDIFYGESEDFKVKASYGFKTENGKKVHLFTVKLLDRETDNATYYLRFNLDKEYSSKFSLNPVSNSLTAKIEVLPFDQKELVVTVSVDSKRVDVVLRSIIPDGTVDYLSALNSLNETQPQLIENYKDENGDLVLEISMRVLCKDEKAYYYVGLTKNNDLKALLIDGESLEVLAIRSIF